MNENMLLVDIQIFVLTRKGFLFFSSLKLLGLQQNPLMRKVVVDLPDRISWEMQNVEMLLHLPEIAWGAHNMRLRNRKLQDTYLNNGDNHEDNDDCDDERY